MVELPSVAGGPAAGLFIRALLLASSCNSPQSAIFPRLDTPPPVVMLYRQPKEKRPKMNQVALEEQLSRLEKEIRLGGAEVDERFLDLRADLDRLHLEMTAVKTYLETAFPTFREQFPQILARTIQEVNPE